MDNVLITGASSGIGQAIYLNMKKDKRWKTFGLSRRGPDLTYDLRDSLPEIPILEHVELLINCAGIMPFKETKEVFDVNFWGTYNLIQNILPVLSKGGCIINIASVSATKPDADLPIYAASKAAIIALTKSLAKKHAPNIRVNCISPGFTMTNLVGGEALPQNLLDTIPLGYEALPIDIMPVIKMIWESRYMTGSNIVIDGGVSL